MRCGFALIFFILLINKEKREVIFFSRLPVYVIPISFLCLSAFHKVVEAAASEVLCEVQTWGRSLKLTPHQVSRLRNLLTREGASSWSSWKLLEAV